MLLTRVSSHDSDGFQVLFSSIFQQLKCSFRLYLSVEPPIICQLHSLHSKLRAVDALRQLPTTSESIPEYKSRESAESQSCRSFSPEHKYWSCCMYLSGCGHVVGIQYRWSVGVVARRWRSSEVELSSNSCWNEMSWFFLKRWGAVMLKDMQHIEEKIVEIFWVDCLLRCRVANLPPPLSRSTERERWRGKWWSPAGTGVWMFHRRGAWKRVGASLHLCAFIIFKHSFIISLLPRVSPFNGRSHRPHLSDAQVQPGPAVNLEPTPSHISSWSSKYYR